MLSCANIYRKTLPVLVIASAAMVMYAQPAASQAAGNVKCNGCVGAKDLKNNAVMASKIRGSAVTNSKLANSSVTGTKIQDGTVVENDLSAAVRAKLNSPNGIGDITAVRAGTGLLGGGESGDVTLRLDPSVMGWGGSGIGSSGSVTIPHSAFQALDEVEEEDHNIFPQRGYTRPDNAKGNDLCLAAPVQLPDGVTVSDVEMVIRDNTLFDFQYVLWRTDIDPTNGDTGTQAMAVITTFSQSPLKRNFPDDDFTIAHPVVDADGYAYTIGNPNLGQKKHSAAKRHCLRSNGYEGSANLYAAIIRY